jgi:DNA-binding response OmpR family regulator
LKRKNLGFAFSKIIVMHHSVLIVDDDALILKTLSDRFSGWGTEVYSASSPQQAKDVMEKVTPELVMLDLLLTKDDGAEDVIDFMKSKTNLEHVPVLVLTNLDKPDLKQLMLGMGVKEYLIKGSLSVDAIYEKAMGYLEPEPKD